MTLEPSEIPAKYAFRLNHALQYGVRVFIKYCTEQHVQEPKVLGEGGGIITVSSFLGGT